MASRSELRKIREKFFSKSVYFFDLDGTLYMGSKVIDGAVALIQRLRDDQKTLFFFTNNSSRSENDYLTKLTQMGFCPSRNEIVMSTHVLVRYLKSKSLRRIFLLGTPSMESMLIKSEIEISQEPQAVVVGFDKTLNYEKLQMACRLVEKGVPYIVTHPDLYCPTDQGREPDCGAFAKVIELVTEVRPKVVLGKPHPLMMKEAMLRCRASKREMILIGDRLSTDVLMARSCGIESLLVFSGETTSARLKKSKLKPTYSIGSVQNLLG